MAIRDNVTSERGYVYKNQYLRIDSIRVFKNSMDIDVGVYDNETNTVPSDIIPHTVITIPGAFNLYSTQNLWQQAYVYVKQRWPDSVDV